MHLNQAIRKAPQNMTTAGFQQAVTITSLLALSLRNIKIISCIFL
jgi:hypothetical protein